MTSSWESKPIFRHNEDGTMTTEYVANGHRHRINLPAVIHEDHSKEWWEYGRHHRTGGPAIDRADGHKEWWEHGHCLRNSDGSNVSSSEDFLIYKLVQ